MLDLTNAQVYDVEVLINVFTLTAEPLYSNVRVTWEISEFRDDRQALFEWFNWLQQNQIPMIGFNNIGYDYLIIHFIFTHPDCTPADIYAKNQEIFASQDNRFGMMIWDRDRFAPQIDLYKVHHFDNRSKTTSLKALEINMRSPRVADSPVEFGTCLTREQIERDLIPYNGDDVGETKRFAFYSMDAIKFRIGLIAQFGIEALNYSDVKIGAKMLEQRLGDDICYDRSTGRKRPRQTPRGRIALSDIIFPYVQFRNPEFQRVLDFMRTQALTSDDIDDPDAPLKTKGAIDITANVGGLEFKHGTGGVHASVTAQKFVADDTWLIRDIDVARLYPSIAVENSLAPAHLGEAFITEYRKVIDERGLHAKGTYQNGALKLAANGPWGQSNNKYTIFFDPQYAMTIPINGQLLICMLAEWLLTVPTITLIQANTDGITYRIHRDHEPAAAEICRQWEAYTHLKLEDADYRAMWIRDVNNYIAIDTKGKRKQKGAYWHPDPLDYANSISTASPPCWYKDLGNIVSTRAAVAAMVHGVDPVAFIRAHSDPFDFMLRAKVDRASQLLLGGVPVQRTTRYYVARDGAPMVKISPPPAGHEIGQWKRAPRITKAEYDRVMAETHGEWSELVCTKSKSKYDNVQTSIQAGWKIAECNDARLFRFENIEYSYYVAEAMKLIIS